MKADSAVGYPSGGQTVAMPWAASLRELVLRRKRFGGKVITWSGTLLFYNRNKITEMFLKSGRTWLLMTDTDIVFSPQDVDALFDAAGQYGPGVYSGVVVTLSHRGVIPIYGHWNPERQSCEFRPKPHQREDPIEAVDIVPTAFLLVHREVFEAIGDGGWFDHLRSTDGEGRTFGEDVAFCLRVLEKKFPIILVPKSRPGHMKTGVFYPDLKPTTEE